MSKIELKISERKEKILKSKPEEFIINIIKKIDENISHFQLQINSLVLLKRNYFKVLKRLNK